MKGRTPTAQEKKHMDLIASFGCFACWFDGLISHQILLHHTDGRTKPNAHSKVIPLCGQHHDYGCKDSVHENQPAFEKKYGTQESIVEFLHNWFDIEIDEGVI